MIVSVEQPWRGRWQPIVLVADVYRGLSASLVLSKAAAEATGAPFWGIPVAKGAGVLWLSGPKAELPPRNMPISSVSLQAMQDFAAANPKLMNELQAVVTDVGTAVDRRPDDVKAAIARLYPTLDVKTTDLLVSTEAATWKTRPLTADDIRHEIAFVKWTGRPAVS
jgi:ABC-type nitrate/sulfonate/bicarbonate transport system substrate-binding protein